MNQELIAINYDGENPTVSGRELHKTLNVATAYKDWFPRMCEYGFVDGVDFNSLNFEQVQTEGTREVRRTITDHQLTVPMAKEIAMLQRTDEGRKVRQHLIRLEEAWNTPEQVMARALKLASKQIEEAKRYASSLERTVEEQRPKALFADAVAASHTTILVGELAKVLKQNGVEIGQNRLFDWLRCNGYLIRRNGTDYNMPTQKAMDMGLFEVKETVISHADGHTSITKTPKVTGRGQQCFVNKFLGSVS